MKYDIRGQIEGVWDDKRKAAYLKVTVAGTVSYYVMQPLVGLCQPSTESEYALVVGKRETSTEEVGNFITDAANPFDPS